MFSNDWCIIFVNSRYVTEKNKNNNKNNKTKNNFIIFAIFKGRALWASNLLEELVYKIVTNSI